MKKITIILILVFTSKQLIAQEIDIISTNYLMTTYINHDLKISQTDFTGGYPVLGKLRPNDLLLATGQYKYTDFNSEERFYELSPQIFTGGLGYLMQLNKKVSLIGLVQGYMGSMTSSLSDPDLLFNIGGMVRYQFSDKVTLGIGAVRRELHDSKTNRVLLPLVTINWKATDKITLDAFLPSYGSIKYRHSDKFQAGAGMRGFFDSYTFTEDVASQLAQQGADNQTITGMHMFFITEFYITKNIVFSFKPGLLVFYNVTVNDADGNQLNRNRGEIDSGIENQQDLDQDTSEGLGPNYYIEGGLSFRLDPSKLRK